MFWRIIVTCVLFDLLSANAIAMFNEPHSAATVKEILLVPFAKYGGITTSKFYMGMGIPFQGMAGLRIPFMLLSLKPLLSLHPLPTV